MSEEYEPAFPCHGLYKGAGGDLHPTPSVHVGISVRDYFAAKALQGILARADEYTTDAARDSYAYADAMMKARG